jgi:hypothetical protein
MKKYVKQELSKYWPVSAKLMAKYLDGTHTYKDSIGDLYWKKNNQVHRLGDKPAWIHANGTLSWYQNNQLHRLGDRPAWISANGSLYWYQNGRMHRDGDKPAYIDANGSLSWLQNSQRHRFRGPAVIYPNGKCKWWINDKNITKAVNAWLADEEWQGTPEQIFEFQLRFM